VIGDSQTSRATHHWQDFYSILATILASEELFGYLCDNDEENLKSALDQGAISITERDLGHLRSIEFKYLIRFREILLAKHAKHAQAVMPTTVGLLEIWFGAEHFRSLFWEESPCAYEPTQESRRGYLELVSTFVQVHSSEFPPRLREIAKFEYLCGCVSLVEAGSQKWPEHPFAPGAQLEQFTFDVTRPVGSFEMLDAMARSDTYVAIWPKNESMAVAKLGPRSFDILKNCSGAISPEEIRKSVGKVSVREIETVIKRARDSGLLSGAL
jgi:hypothetical protein